MAHRVSMGYLTIFLQILGSLAVFLYGLKVMSEGLQKASGAKLRQILEKATDNRFMGTLSGFLVTCAVQSSSATTVMVVAFCSAGLMTLGQSLGVIFGANIGTTTTAWIVSLLGFNVKITAFAVPMIGIGFFSQFIQRWRLPHRLGQALVGFGLLFLGLAMLKDAIPSVENAPGMLELLHRLEPDSVVGLTAAVVFGAVITALVQSSSASMAITLTAAAKGYIDFPTACAIALGQNIGTTITAVLAAFGAPATARRAALGHFLFNLIGSVWPILFFAPFLAFVDSLVPGNPYGAGEDAHLVALPTHIAAYHTAFNIINTALFLPFVAQFERLIVRLMPSGADENRHDLAFLTIPFGSTHELVIPAAQREVDRMAGVTVEMVQRIQEALTADRATLARLTGKIRQDERTTDVLEHKISEFLAELVSTQLSSPTSRETLSLMSMINDLERIGDHGEKISLLLDKIAETGITLTPDAIEELKDMARATEENLRAMHRLILHRERDPIPAAIQREEHLNQLRDRYRQSQLQRMSEGRADALAGVVFTDLLTSFEKMGDHSYNVVEATAGIK